jgi:ABC-type molybdate transport system substrate-binding protein
MIRRIILPGLLLLASGVMPSPANADAGPALRLLAAGSLGAALGAVAQEFAAAEKFGSIPSSVLPALLEADQP